MPRSFAGVAGERTPVAGRHEAFGYLASHRIAAPFARCQCRKDGDELGEKKSALPCANIKFAMHATRVQHAEITAKNLAKVRIPQVGLADMVRA